MKQVSEVNGGTAFHVIEKSNLLIVKTTIQLTLKKMQSSKEEKNSFTSDYKAFV